MFNNFVIGQPLKCMIRTCGSNLVNLLAPVLGYTNTGLNQDVIALILSTYYPYQQLKARFLVTLIMLATQWLIVQDVNVFQVYPLFLI